jgi:hypothetical protein
MDTNDFKKITTDAKNLGHDVSMQDIAYVFLCESYENAEIAYKVLFGKESIDAEVNKYKKSKKIVFLTDYIKSNYIKPSKKAEVEFSTEEDMDLSFEENKSKMISLLNKIEELVASGDMSAKDAVKLEAEIRTKLNDKFSVDDQSEQSNVIVVEPKFNLICPHTNRECYVNSKEQVMKRYNLIEKE